MSMANPADIEIIVSGLAFPEGPVAMRDGSVILVEIASGKITRVDSTGRVSVVADVGGGPNGLAMGPDGALYICNCGGFIWRTVDGGLRPALGTPADYVTGAIQRLDLETGVFHTLYDQCDGLALRGPNDIVFDSLGGFYFTDLGKSRPYDRDYGAVYYAKADGSFITRLAFPMTTPNGIGLSPDQRTVYVAETETSRLWGFDLVEPGVPVVHPFPSPHGGRLVCGLPGYQRFDSLAVDEHGNICVATLLTGHISVISPDGRLLGQTAMPEPFPTNICFGGPDRRDAYITLSSTGQLARLRWPQAGLPLAYEG